MSQASCSSNRRIASAAEMAMATPDRFLEQLVLSVGDEGLEELTLRLVEPDYPDSHRTGRGRDGGIDVLSDHALPPGRAWQAKFYPHDDINWTKCRTSLDQAMARPHPPRHYTFVFPRRLRGKERDHWSTTFLPEAHEAHAALETLDYWDDLPRRLEQRGDLVDALSGGALGLYAAKLIAQAHSSAAAGQQRVLGGGISEQVAAIGAMDSEFRYSFAAGEREPADSAPSEAQFSFHYDPQFAPTFVLSVETQQGWERLTAEQRETWSSRQPQLAFATTSEGEQARTAARVTLAKGQEVRVAGDVVAIEGVQIPKGLRSLGATDHLLRRGTLRIGLSEPLKLTIALQLVGGAAPLENTITLYRVPELPGATEAYAGSFFGAVVTLDLSTPDDTTPEITAPELTPQMTMLDFGLTLAVQGEDPARVLAALGFGWAVAHAEWIELRCDGLLPPDGIRASGAAPPDEHAEETWRHAALVAGALAGLNRLDGGSRTMPGAVTPHGVAIAEMVIALVERGELLVEVPAGQREIEAPLPPGTDPATDPRALCSFTAALPSLMGIPTLTVTQTLENIEPKALKEMGEGRVRLLGRVTGEPAGIRFNVAARAPGRDGSSDPETT
jgi:hypothetical protein